MTRTPIAALPAGLAVIALSGCLLQMDEGQDPIADTARQDVQGITGQFLRSEDLYDIARIAPGLYAVSWDVDIDDEFVEAYFVARAATGRDCGPDVPTERLQALCQGRVEDFCRAQDPEEVTNCLADYGEMRDYLSGLRVVDDPSTQGAIDLMRALAEIDLPKTPTATAQFEIETQLLPKAEGQVFAAGHVLQMNTFANLEYGLPIMGPQVVPGSLMLIGVTEAGFDLFDTTECLGSDAEDDDPRKLSADEALPLLTACSAPDTRTADPDKWTFSRQN